MSEIVLWLFVLNLGVAFGAGLYEHRIVMPEWFTTPDAGWRWQADAAVRSDTGRRFWALVTTVPLTLLTLVNLFAAWHSSGAVRPWWLAAALTAAAERAFTFAYFIPTLIWLMKSRSAASASAVAKRWWNLNYLRHALVLAAWLLALRAFALYYRQLS